MANETAFILLGSTTGIVAVYANESEANERRDRFNADPFIEPGTPDQDAPYRVEPWSVT